jgi:hypothetical protein
MENNREEQKNRDVCCFLADRPDAGWVSGYLKNGSGGEKDIDRNGEG